MTAEMRRATFRFYADLNDFLPAERRGVDVEQAFLGSPAVKDLIEAIGVPHPEVDLILADGAPVEFAWRVADGARVSVYPAFRAVDVASLSRVRPPRPARLAFVLDGHLGRLARYLRMAGIDTRWRAEPADAELARESHEAGGILLTRDVGLLKRSEVIHGAWVRATDPEAQLIEVVRRFDLARAADPFCRCLECNTPLARAEKAAIASQLPPGVCARHEDFRRCPTCARVYWRGTHWQRMAALLERVVGPPAYPR